MLLQKSTIALALFLLPALVSANTTRRCSKVEPRKIICTTTDTNAGGVSRTIEWCPHGQKCQASSRSQGTVACVEATAAGVNGGGSSGRSRASVTDEGRSWRS